MFSDYCPIISAEASNGDVIEFFSDRNEEKVSIPFWMYYHSAEVHRSCSRSQPCLHRSERNTAATAYYMVSGHTISQSPIYPYSSYPIRL